MLCTTISDRRTGERLALRAGWHRSLWNRFRGLMLRRSLPDGEAIVLVPCGSVHMLLMRFSIDVVYLDREARVVKLVENLRPYRVSFGGRGAHSVIELPAGTLARCSVRVGDTLSFEPLLREAAQR